MNQLLTSKLKIKVGGSGGNDMQSEKNDKKLSRIEKKGDLDLSV